ncbi:hypothetical protein BOTBODRAFT_176370 [Botryobasidium botryosum FD-172 SS1]|uniref:2Fe-2S ferredoxin-type domain-containing protein n=1 Tax=Botryobasidium botryosum (strain FD-172 SS1) TaxID=930990 RepID=A0A067MLH8_BOTB1|nr:hypothetical protein BOTBODRAFT_176370 [Botryobasidium botryosum FD-172 SS1]
MSPLIASFPLRVSSPLRAHLTRTFASASSRCPAILGVTPPRPCTKQITNTFQQKQYFNHSATLLHGNITRPKPGTGIKVNFKDSKGQLIKTIEANEGDNLLEIAHEHDIDLEGACEGSVACSTCHVILNPEHFDMLPEPEDEENDMLDMAFGLTDTSRLGCQVKLTRELDGLVATLPSATRNMFVDGAKPTKH